MGRRQSWLKAIALTPAGHWWRLDSCINDAWYRRQCQLTCCCGSACLCGGDVIDDVNDDPQTHVIMLCVCLQYILLLCFLLITEVVVTSIVTIFRERVRHEFDVNSWLKWSGHLSPWMRLKENVRILAIFRLQVCKFGVKSWKFPSFKRIDL